MSQSYNPKEIEKKWQKVWEDEKLFRQLMISASPNIMPLLNFHIHPDRDFM